VLLSGLQATYGDADGKCDFNPQFRHMSRETERTRSIGFKIKKLENSDNDVDIA
jgi:hypothetical protein